MSPLLRVKDLTKHFPIKGGLWGQEVARVHALQGVTFEIQKGETLGVVGESGCGKSTLGRCITRLHDPSSGSIFFQDQNITNLSGEDLRRLRRRIQIVFQDPYSSLNPRMTIGSILEEPLIIHRLAKDAASRNKRVLELLNLVGLPNDAIYRYPHEFSGGQRQRVGIARALSVEPELIVCDEPVSALDVSIQAQVINLLSDLQKELHLTYLFIAHDLNVVRHVSDRIAVMYLGKIIELADSDTLFEKPLHPYTQCLLAAIPIADPNAISRSQKQSINQPLQGDVPSPISPPAGCHFHPRCPKADRECSQRPPPLSLVSKQKAHEVSCFKVPF